MWKLVVETNQCHDEYLQVAGIHGLFTGSGWCIAGICWRQNLVGVVLGNHLIRLEPESKHTEGEGHEQA